MSRIGKKIINLPEGVRISYKDSLVEVDGPRGKLTQTINFKGNIEIDGNRIKLTCDTAEEDTRAVYGLARSLINNMVTGVTNGYQKTLKIVGVGYKAQAQGQKLTLNVGYSHPINYEVPQGIKIETPDPNTIIVSGIDKQMVGQAAADIRKFRKPEPYKGKGIMYADERVRRKAGKTGIK